MRSGVRSRASGCALRSQLKGIKPDEIIDIDLLKGKQREDSFRAVNPQMLIPALIEDGGPVLFQSMAIMEYLEETHPQPALLPKDPLGRARVRGICQIFVSDSHPMSVPRIRNYLTGELKLDNDTMLKWVRHWQNEALRAAETHLSQKATGKYCHGDSCDARRRLSRRPGGRLGLLRRRREGLSERVAHLR